MRFCIMICDKAYSVQVFYFLVHPVLETTVCFKSQCLGYDFTKEKTTTHQRLFRSGKRLAFVIKGVNSHN